MEANLKTRVLVIAGVAMAAAASSAHGGLEFGFVNVTNNSSLSSTTKTHYYVDIIDAGSGAVDFKFSNLGPTESSITDIYFDDGHLLGISSIDDSMPGVDFDEGATPPNLPGGNTIGFETTAGFSTDSSAPAQPNGVNPGEMVTIRFDLINGATYQDVLDDMMNGALRIGIHVQGFPNGESESFANKGRPVPLPTSAALAGLGMIGLAARRRR